MNLKNAAAVIFSKHRKEAPSNLSTPWSTQAKNAGTAPKYSHDYPRPQFQRSDWTCLNGYWDYAITDSGKRPSSFDGKILVPFSPEAALSGVSRQLLPGSFLWYRRTFRLASFSSEQRCLLHFGAVDQVCSLWINGIYQGSHNGGYLPFTFDITKALRKGSNSIMLKVRDDSDKGWMSQGKQTLRPKGMFYTAQSGIWQTVWLETVPLAYLKEVKITPDFDHSSVHFHFLTEPAACSLSKHVEIFFDGELLYSGDTAGSSLTASLDVLHPWSPETPDLYDVLFSMGEDHAAGYFVMRKISVEKDADNIPRIFLNNMPYFQNGVLDQGYWPDGLYTPPTDDAMVYDIKAMKKAGFNMIRKHIKIEPLRWYYHCDRLGMLVWQDMVNGCGRPFMPLMCYLPTLFPSIASKLKDSLYPLFKRQNKKGRDHWLLECRSTVEHLYNCPCIVLWVPFNEGWGQFDSLKAAETIRRLDPSRLIDHASGWFDQGGGDIKSVHNYFRPLTVKAERRPFVISEYGGITCRIPGHLYSSQSYGYQKSQTAAEFKEAFLKLQEQIYSLEKKGLCAAVYTQVSDVEEEINGILTYDRKINKLAAVDSAQ